MWDRNTPATVSGQQLCQQGAFSEPSCYGGHARISTVCKEAKAANPATICVDAGDEFLGTAWDVLYEGNQTAQVLPLTGVDVMTVGNHEFDYGVVVLARFLSKLSFPVVGACNMDLSGEPTLAPLIKKWTVLNVGGMKVGLLGYIASNTAEISSAGAIVFSDPATAVPQCMAEFLASPESTGVTIIGLVSHAGINVDEAVAPVVPEVDFIVSAHSHTEMFPGKVGPCLAGDPADASEGPCPERDDSSREYPVVVAGTPIMQQFFASKYVGKTTMSFDTGGTLNGVSGEVIPLGATYDDAGALLSTVADDEAVKVALMATFQEVLAYTQQVVGVLPAALSAARPDIRIQEMPLGNLLCDAMIASALGLGLQTGAGAPLVCIMNGGGIRADLPAGQVTYGDVVAVVPFGNTVEVVQLTGAALRAALEHAYAEVEKVSSPPGKFAHIGGSRGLSVVVDVAAPPGSRITSLAHDCAEIADTDRFQVVVNSFIQAGGDGFTVLDVPPQNRTLTFGPTLADSLAAHITANTPVPQQLVDVEGRIVYADAAAADSKCSTRARALAIAGAAARWLARPAGGAFI
eukprot:jgi/Ulvmu1/8404/UM042_0111.1